MRGAVLCVFALMATQTNAVSPLASRLGQDTPPVDQGPAPADAQIRVVFALRMKDGAVDKLDVRASSNIIRALVTRASRTCAQKTATAVSDPSSPEYGQFLSKAQVDAIVDAGHGQDVADWATSHNWTLVSVDATSVVTRALPDQIRRDLGCEARQFREQPLPIRMRAGPNSPPAAITCG